MPAKRVSTKEILHPSVAGPIEGGAHGFPFSCCILDLAAEGYIEEEFFLSGFATAFTSSEPLTTDGIWNSVSPVGELAPYTTRLLVIRPIDHKKFNGTVVVEWLNVSTGVDLPVMRDQTQDELLRDGFAWVGVSAQVAGIASPGPFPKGPGLKVWDPPRYHDLSHENDSYSYDIFTQAGLALLSPSGVGPLNGLKVERLIATGDSQSGDRLVTYYNAIDHLTHVFDGFLIEGREKTGSPLSQAPLPEIGVPPGTLFRTDHEVPLLDLHTETELGPDYCYGDLSARQPDNPHYRSWEIPGTAHADDYSLNLMNKGLEQWFGFAPDFNPEQPPNKGPLHYVASGALYALDRWIKTGAPASSAPRIAMNGQFDVSRDTHGNAIDGLRTPQVDVPIATESGVGNTAAGEGNPPGCERFCFLFGSTTEFSESQLASLYPTHEAYVSKVQAATERAVHAGFILPADAEVIVMEAEASSIGR
jgi:hypothetical protein